MSGFTALHSTREWMELYGPSGRGAVISIGNFDGFHLGHQKIVREVLERAHGSHAVAGVITFDPHPLKVLRPGKAPPLVETLEQRLSRFAAAGLEAALVLHFDRELAAVTAEEFVRTILVQQMHTEAVLVGDNFRFGHRQQGNVKMLQEMGRRLGFAVHIAEPVVIKGEVVSSTAIREAILEGRAGSAARMLGRPFALTGKIQSGAGRGSTILFPTLNLVPEQELLPKIGVYVTETQVQDRTYQSVTNVGMRPTFNGTHLSIESHLFGFSERLNGGPLEVRFWERLRDEKKFSGPEELRKQIAADIEEARRFFEGRGALLSR